MNAIKSFNAPRGMRDFYPEDMKLRNRVFDAWRAAGEQSGFEPYDACVVESLELLERKGGEEIANQIYSFEDKSGRRLALRPEMTPTLARMIAARQSALPMPVKWSAIAQCFRYERMTRGRKREHYQWNLDIIGAEGVAAEAEIIFTAVSALRLMGIPEQAYQVRISSRTMLSELLSVSGIAPERHPAVFLALDKREKIPDSEVMAILQNDGLGPEECAAALKLAEIREIDDAERILGEESPALRELRELFDLLAAYGVAESAVFDISVIRGLAYYTGIVFEAFDSAGKLRALFGGGRYDGLLSALGGKPETAVGMGFGDVVVAELIAELEADAPAAPRNGYIVGFMTEEDRVAATKVAARLRRQGDPAILQLKPQKPRAFFSQAAASGAAEAIFIGPDDRAGGVARAKNLDTRKERDIALE